MTLVAHTDRADAWRAELGDAFSDLAPEALDDTTPDGRMSGTDLGAVVVYEVSGSPQIVQRTAAAVRRVPTDFLKMCVQVSGRATVHQHGREIVLEAGQMALYDTGVPYALRLEDAWTCAVMAFPRDALGMPWHLLADTMDHAYPVTTGPGAVLTGFVTATLRQRASMSDAAATRLGEAGLSLLAGTLSDAGIGGSDRAADALRLQIMTYVRQHLVNPRLSHTSVAAAHHMSARTLHRLFQDEPETITESIRHLRLEAIRRDMADPLLAGRSTASIAAHWCMAEQSHFSRAFRARYGVNPSSARRAHG